MSDLLANLLDTVEVERCSWSIAEAGGHWGIAVPAADVVRFYLVVEGELYLRKLGYAAQTRLLACGDVAVVLPGADLELTDAHMQVINGSMPLPDLDDRDDVREFVIGNPNGARTVLVCGAIQIDRQRCRPLLQRLRPVIHIRRTEDLAAYWTQPFCNLAALRHAASGSGASAVLRQMSALAISHVVRAFMVRANENCAPYERSLTDPRITMALQLINMQPARHWSVSRLAQEVGMSRSAFAATFSMCVGQSPMRYVMHVRMTKAAHLLKVRSVSVTKAGTHVGFVSKAAFARAFRRHFGVSPSSYRRAD